MGSNRNTTLWFGVDHRAGVLLLELRIFCLCQGRDPLALRSGLGAHEILESGSREHEDAVDRIGSDVGHFDPGVRGGEERGAAMHLSRPIAQPHPCTAVL